MPADRLKLSPTGRLWVDVMVRERGADLTLEAYLTERLREMPPPGAPRIADVLQQVVDRGCVQTLNQAYTVLTLLGLGSDLKDFAVARRAHTGDPGELGRALAILGRLRLLDLTLDQNALNSEFEYEVLLEACALGDFARAREMCAGRRAGCRLIADDYVLLEQAMFAFFQEDDDALLAALKEMPRRKVRPWMEGLYRSVAGLVHPDPDQVRDGLLTHIAGLRALRQKRDREHVLSVCAHGLYRLAESISPELVKGFDPQAGLPWDADFHRWCAEHPHPLHEVRIAELPASLGELLRSGLPAWVRPPTEVKWEVRLLSLDPAHRATVEEVAQYCGGSAAQLPPLLAHLPLPLLWGVPRPYARQLAERLAALGVGAEAAPMA